MNYGITTKEMRERLTNQIKANTGIDAEVSVGIREAEYNATHRLYDVRVYFKFGRSDYRAERCDDGSYFCEKVSGMRSSIRNEKGQDYFDEFEDLINCLKATKGKGYRL